MSAHPVWDPHLAKVKDHIYYKAKYVLVTVLQNAQKLLPAT